MVLLTVGCSNSSVVTRMMGALGWNLGSVRPDFMENTAVHLCNRWTAWRKKPFNVEEAKQCLAVLPQPWAIKDPKFCETLKHWLPLFEAYRPALLWVTKDPEYVRQSYARRFPKEFPPGYSDKRFRWCEAYFARWPWGKLRLDVDQIAAAVRLFDPERIYKHRPLKENCHGN